MLEDYIRERRREKNILLMTHIVIGYPSLADSHAMVQEMVAAGVDLVELQIPFSEPIADGPVILKANQSALANGVTVQDCMDFAQEATRIFDIPFLLMTYYNILFKFGVRSFVQTVQRCGIRGMIVPDLPYEEGRDYLDAMRQERLAPIFIYSPTTSPGRMRQIDAHARGFIYCVARKGVTGQETDFSLQMADYLSACRECTCLPLALGFGVKDKADIDFLSGKVDIAVVGSQTIRLVEENGTSAVGRFIRRLR